MFKDASYVIYDEFKSLKASYECMCGIWKLANLWNPC